MEEKSLKGIKGTKIRRQYFNYPIIILYSIMLAVPYFIFVISRLIGKSDAYDFSSTLWTSVLVCFCFSLPFLLLRELNKRFFGRIICVLTKEGIYYPKGMVRWETIENMEYALDAKPRYKSDITRAYRAIIHTRGGKHVVLTSSPFRLIFKAKKYNKKLCIKISGATSPLYTILILTAIFAAVPLYVVLLAKAPGPAPSLAKLITIAALYLGLGILRHHLFGIYSVHYRFWRRILPKKILSKLLLGFYYSSFFIVLLILVYFPNWVVVSLIGIYMGIVQPPVPSRHGNKHLNLPSYDRLCEIYIDKAYFWEKQIEKRKNHK